MKIKGICFLSVMLLLVTSCEYSKEEPIVPLSSVSFKSDVLPIFSMSCSTIGCHAAGDHVPDLSSSNAYNALIDGVYVDTVTVENSELYLRMIDKQHPMPPKGLLPASQLNIIYYWIKTGAKNN